MALLASTIGGAAYAIINGDDKDNGNGFEVCSANSVIHYQAKNSSPGLTIRIVHKEKEMAATITARIGRIGFVLLKTYYIKCRKR